jgi:hypothetical protein
VSIGGSYPGGPRRKSSPDAETVGEQRAPGETRLDRVEDIEARRDQLGRSKHRRQRTKRVLKGLLAALVVASGIGVFLGYRSHKSSEQITSERNAQTPPKQGFDPLFQTNRVLDELWKMEIKQRQPSPP